MNSICHLPESGALRCKWYSCYSLIAAGLIKCNFYSPFTIYHWGIHFITTLGVFLVNKFVPFEHNCLASNPRYKFIKNCNSSWRL